jgi:predicted RNA polymerase sigma factor
VLAAIFGVHNLDIAEHVVQEAFCEAIQVWTFTGVPDNPSAWVQDDGEKRAKDYFDANALPGVTHRSSEPFLRANGRSPRPSRNSLNQALFKTINSK